MAKYHNWNQIHRAFIKLNFKQIADYGQGYIYYLSPLGNKITLQKFNKLPKEYVEALLKSFEVPIPYDVFIKLYSER